MSPHETGLFLQGVALGLFLGLILAYAVIPFMVDAWVTLARWARRRYLRSPRHRER